VNLQAINNDELPSGRRAVPPMVTLSRRVFYFNTTAVEELFQKRRWVRVYYKDKKLYLVSEGKKSSENFPVGFYLSKVGKKSFGQLPVKRILARMGISIEEKKRVFLKTEILPGKSKKTLAIVIPLA